MSFPAQEVLITEHLTFAPLSLVDDIINTANALLYKSVNAMEQLLTNLPGEIISDEEVETGIHKFETLLENAVDRNFDAMELFVLRNIVNIPEDLVGWIQLKHHAGLDFSSDDSAEVEEEMIKCRKTLAASQKVKAMIERERHLNELKLEALDRHAKELAFLEKIASAQDVGSVTDSGEFLKAQIESLARNLNETSRLGEILQTELQPSERSKYIEKVLLETVQDGSWERELAEAAQIGSLEDIQRAAAVLREK